MWHGDQLGLLLAALKVHPQPGGAGNCSNHEDGQLVQFLSAPRVKVGVDPDLCGWGGGGECEGSA